MEKEGERCEPFELLTEAEKEVVRGLAKGYKEPDLAKEMGTYLGKIKLSGRANISKEKDNSMDLLGVFGQLLMQEEND